MGLTQTWLTQYVTYCIASHLLSDNRWNSSTCRYQYSSSIPVDIRHCSPVDTHRCLCGLWECVPYSGKLSWDKTFAFQVNFQFRGENFREWGACGHVEPFNIATNHKDWRRMESYSIHTSIRGYHIHKDVWEASVNCYLARGNLVISMIHMPWLLLRHRYKTRLISMVETGVATRINVGQVPCAISSVCHPLSDL